MADVKINQLPNKTTLADTDVVIVESATQTMKMTVGTLKDLLGIQSGGIVESGSNSNGHYIKYADGTMVCHRNDLILPYHSTTGLRAVATFPAQFNAKPTVIPTLSVNLVDWNTDERSKVAFIGIDATSNNSQVTIRVNVSLGNTWSTTQSVNNNGYIAIGRWK